MKSTYSAVILIVAVILFAWTKGNPVNKPKVFDALSGTWYGHYISHSDSSRRNFVLVLKENGKMDVYESDTIDGDKARGTFMIIGATLLGNFQYIQDGPVTNIEATLSAGNESMSGAWNCGADGGTFAAANPLLSPQRGKRVRQ